MKKKIFTPILICIFSSMLFSQNHSLHFDSVDDHVEIASTPELTSDQFTIEAWIKADAGGVNQAIIAKYNSNIEEISYVINVEGSNKILFGVYESQTPSVIYRAIRTDLPVLTPGVWQHVAASYNLATQDIKIYVDGIEPPSTVVPGSASLGSIYNGTQPVYIGRAIIGNGSSYFFRGSIDEVRYWNTERTQTEISNNKDTELTGTESGLVSYYKMDDTNSLCDVADCGPNGNHGTRNGAGGSNNLPQFSTDIPTITDVACGASTPCITPAGNSLHFDSVDDHVEIASTPELTSDQFTIEAWIKADAGGVNQAIIAKYNSNIEEISYVINVEGSNKILFGVYESQTPSVIYRAIRTDLPVLTPGVWQHVAASYNLATQDIKIYVDGIEPPSTVVPGSASLGSIYNGTQPVYIGRAIIGNGSSYFFRGSIDEVRYWNTERTQTEISNNKDTELTGTESGLVSYYKMDDTNSLCDVEDCSPNGNHGTRNGAGGSNNLPQFSTDIPTITDVACGASTPCITPAGNSLHFDSVDDHVEIASTPELTSDQFTIEAWIKADAGGVNQAIIAKYNSNIEEISYVINVEGSNKILFGVYESQTPSVIYRAIRTDLPVLTPGVWQHVAASYNLATQDIKIYVDGIEPPSTVVPGSASLGSIYNGTQPVYIGRAIIGNGSSYFFRGSIDEVRYWNTERTQAEISNNKDTELTGTEVGLVSYYKMDDTNSLCDVADCGPNGNHGTRNGAGGSNNLPQFSTDIPTITDVACGASGCIPPAGNSFITTWKTDTPGSICYTCITIPTNGGGYNYDVDWNNDGIFDEFGLSGDVTHDFGVAGTYTIRIQGDFPRIYFNYTGDRKKILSIDNWGDIAWTSMRRAFRGAVNLVYNASDAPNLQGVTNLSQMFHDAESFNGDISNWDVSNVTNMSEMFRGAGLFNQDLNTWDVSSVTNMSGMFHSAYDFNGSIGDWNVSSVTDMTYLFRGASSFNQNINNWNVSKVTDMSYMFLGAAIFNNNINDWNVSKVGNMTGMFRSAPLFNQPLNNWDVSKVGNMQSMFLSAHSFNQPLNNWDVSKVGNMESMFNTALSFNQNLNNWNVSKVGNMRRMFRSATVFNGNITDWSVSKVLDMSNMFTSAVAFDRNISSWKVSKVRNMSGMFRSAIAFNKNLNDWDVSKVINMNSMFRNASSFDRNLGNWDISSVTTMVDMLNNSGLSVANYDNTLIGWKSQAVFDITLGANGLDYCNGQVARTSLIQNYGWTITGDDLDCSGFRLDGIALPDDYYLYQNYPNPAFNQSETTISFYLPVASKVRLEVFDPYGRLVSVLTDEELPKGKHSYPFPIKTQKSGMYSYRLEANKFMDSRTMVILNE